MSIYLLRHAQTSANKNGSLSCNHKELLTSEGLEQAKALIPNLSKIEIDSIWCSPLPRAIQTIKPFLQASSQKAFIKPSIAEGQLNLDLAEPIHDPIYEEAILDEEFRSIFLNPNDYVFPPEKEPIPQFRGRVFSTLMECKGLNENILMVTHGHFIREFLNALLMPQEAVRFPISNCSLTKIDIDENHIIHYLGVPAI